MLQNLPEVSRLMSFGAVLAVIPKASAFPTMLQCFPHHVSVAHLFCFGLVLVIP